MRLLADTHTLIWHQGGDARLPITARNLIDDPANEDYLSLCSVWEMSIKQGLGKLGLKTGVSTMIQNAIGHDFRLLPIELAHGLAVQDLPLHHGDPFDRLLIAQA